MARRRNRRLVPDGALSSRPSANLGTRPSSTGLYLDEGNPMAKRADGFRPRPRPSRAASGSPARLGASPGGSASPEEIFGAQARARSPGILPTRPNGTAHNASPPSENSVDENEVPESSPQIPAHAQARIASFMR